jgi:hypothetical protein
MAVIGFNPYANMENSIDQVMGCIHNCDIEDIHKYISGVKQCIFEGYKLNIAVWDAKKKVYTLRKSHLELPISNSRVGIASKMEIMKYGDSNPKYIIVDKIFFMRDFKENIYVPKIDNVSVLDGFIPLDIMFDSIL